MTNLVLIGAGASYGSGSVEPYPPPLGNGEHGLFSKLELAGGVAAGLPDKLKALFRTDFERGMADYYEYADGNIMAFQRQLAGYLAQFKPSADNV